MTKIEALQFVGHCVDNALSPRKRQDIPQDLSKVRFVGWQCGFEPMFVAVWSYLDTVIDEDKAVEIAVDYLQEIGWFGGIEALGLIEPPEPDYVL